MSIKIIWPTDIQKVGLLKSIMLLLAAGFHQSRGTARQTAAVPPTTTPHSRLQRQRRGGAPKNTSAQLPQPIEITWCSVALVLGARIITTIKVAPGMSKRHIDAAPARPAEVPDS
ncbi:MAG: hypothetical protein IPG93_05235 [Burkholderiales bacterium]|nr:hypothetical protein [Burkholderiales bacterium]